MNSSQESAVRSQESGVRSRDWLRQGLALLAGALLLVLVCLLAVAGGAVFGLLEARSQEPEAFVAGGAIAPDGRTEVVCDLPEVLRLKNTAGRDGAGLCVPTSMEQAGRFQNVAALVGLQQWMTSQPGGADPAKVDQIMKQFAPQVDYLQHTDGDEKFLKAALATGRMVCVTYAGHCPRYGTSATIAHMVNLVYLDDAQACILDNNFPGQYLWMTAAEFIGRWKGLGPDGKPYYVHDRLGRPFPVGGGWAIVFTAPAPPPPPRIRSQ
jgi:hypothetical protein